MKQLLVFSLLLFASSCTEDFEELNTNENAPSNVQPELLLRQVLYGYGDDMGYEGFVAGSLLSQHFAMIDFNGFDRHALSSPQEGGNPWDILYTYLRDNETLLGQSRMIATQSVYEGPAMVMKAYLAMTLTDLFGDVPYFTAFSGRANGVVTPVYDAQEDIYQGEDGILDLLERAVPLMRDYDRIETLGGDILFGGDLDGWVRFANSLRFKALIRISGRVDVADRLSALAESGDLLASADQNATFDFTDGPPNNYPLALTRIGIFNVFLMSENAENILAPLNDPRTAVLFRPSAIGNDFNGIINGIASTEGITPDEFARPGTIFRERTGDLDFNYLTSWETNFLLAEAAARDLIDGDARAFYETGVRQAFDYWGAELPTDYLGSAPTAYDPDRALEQIITQKWVASTGNAYEAWAEWRRTGFPGVLPVAASLNGGLYPVRMPYPADEQALNFENYRVAAEATEGNSINVPVWWDVE